MAEGQQKLFSMQHFYCSTIKRTRILHRYQIATDNTFVINETDNSFTINLQNTSFGCFAGSMILNPKWSHTSDFTFWGFLYSLSPSMIEVEKDRETSVFIGRHPRVNYASTNQNYSYKIIFLKEAFLRVFKNDNSMTKIMTNFLIVIVTSW